MRTLWQAQSSTMSRAVGIPDLSMSCIYTTRGNHLVNTNQARPATFLDVETKSASPTWHSMPGGGEPSTASQADSGCRLDLRRLRQPPKIPEWGVRPCFRLTHRQVVCQVLVPRQDDSVHADPGSSREVR